MFPLKQTEHYPIHSPCKGCHDSRMKIKISPNQKERLRQKVIALFMDDFDEEISDFKADQILEAFIEKLAPDIYNTAIEDMKVYLMGQIEDIDAIFQK